MPPRRKSRGQNASQPKKTIQGTISINRRGKGYVSWPEIEGAPLSKKEQRDIEVATQYLNGALNGDEVEVEVKGLFPRPQGAVVGVVRRAKETFVATVKREGNNYIAIAADQRFYKPIELVGIPEVSEGEKVLVKLESFAGNQNPTGTVVERIGKAGAHRTEMNAIILEHGFSIDFPIEVKEEAKKIEEEHEHTIAREALTRSDFRSKTTFTIDPPDAKDFDDALSVEDLRDGTFEIGVHIADATFFVRPGMALDEEMQKRGTSVYLVDATIPMLPHELSGNVCSLVEGQDRLTFSAIFRMNDKGEVLSRRFERTIINSNKRFTYEEAQKVLDTGGLTSPAQNPLTSPAPQPAFASGHEYAPELGILRHIARKLRAKRNEEGAIDFGDNEFKFELDADGKPLRVVRKQRIETNELIEEFMLLANREVAKHISDLIKKNSESGGVFLYRIHDTPKEDRIEELATFVKAMGYDFEKKRKHYTAKDIAKLLKEIEGKPEEHLIRTATLRSMAKAIYSTKNIGHFGLAFEFYTHFTSPIRRFPDMLVHRILASYIEGHPYTKREFGHLEKLCIAASAREAEAVEAERESVKYKQVEFMMGKIGQEFDTVISGVTDWGLYVEDENTGAEGLVRVRSIGNEYFNYSAKEYALVGERSKKKYALGDRVRVKLVAADLAARTLDFELVNPIGVFRP
jgi:ribonuclease R